MGDEKKSSVLALALVAFVVVSALVIGLSVGLTRDDDDDDDESSKVSQGERMNEIMSDFLTNAGSKKGRSARRHDDEDTKNFKICGESETLQLLAPAVAKTLLSTFGSDCISIEGNFNFLGVQSISSLLNRPSLTHNHDNDCGALRKYVARYEKGGYFSSSHPPAVWIVGETELFGQVLPIEFLLGFDERGGSEPDFVLSLGNIPIGWSPSSLKFLKKSSWLHGLVSSSEVTKFMVSSRTIFSSNDCPVVKGVNLEFSVAKLSAAFRAAYRGIIEFGDDLTISGWLHSKRSRLKLSSDSISIGFSPFDSVYSINSSSVCEPELRRNVRKEIAPRDEDQVFSFSGVTIDVLSLEEVPHLAVAFDFNFNYKYLPSTSGSFVGYTTDDYSLYLEGTIESLNMFEVDGKQLLPADFSTSIHTAMTVKPHLLILTGTLGASLEFGSSSFEVSLKFHAENSELAFVVADLKISDLIEAVGDAVGFSEDQSESLGDVVSFGGLTDFDLAIANGYTVFSHWPESYPESLEGQQMVPGLILRSTGTLKEIVTSLLSPLDDILPDAEIASKIPENEISLFLSVPALEGLSEVSLDLGIEIAQVVSDEVTIDSFELSVHPFSLKISGTINLRVLFPGEEEMFGLVGVAEYENSKLWISAYVDGVWEEFYGLEGFDVGNIFTTLCIKAAKPPICGGGLGFYARLGDIRIKFLSEIEFGDPESLEFCAYVEYLSLGSLVEFFYEINSDNDFPEVLDLILSSLEFEQLYINYSPGDPFSMLFDGTLRLFQNVKAHGRIEILDREVLGVTMKDVRIYDIEVDSTSLNSTLADVLFNDPTICPKELDLICGTLNFFTGQIKPSLTFGDFSLFDFIEGDVPSFKLTVSIPFREFVGERSIDFTKIGGDLSAFW